MFKQLSPCKDCTNRELGCHDKDKCEQYKEWKDFFDTDKQKYQADKYKRKALQEVKNNGYKNMTTRRASNKF